MDVHLGLRFKGPEDYCLWLDTCKGYPVQYGLRCKHFREWFYKLDCRYQHAGFTSTRKLLRIHMRIDQEVQMRMARRERCPADTICTHTEHLEIYPVLDPVLSRRYPCFRRRISNLNPNSPLIRQEEKEISSFFLNAALAYDTDGGDTVWPGEEVLFVDYGENVDQSSTSDDGSDDGSTSSEEETLSEASISSDESENSSGQDTSSNVSSDGEAGILYTTCRGVKRKRDDTNDTLDDDYGGQRDPSQGGRSIGPSPAKKPRLDIFYPNELEQVFKPLDYSTLPVNDWRTVTPKCEPEQTDDIDYSTLPSYYRPAKPEKGNCTHPAEDECLCNVDHSTLFQRCGEWVKKSLLFVGDATPRLNSRSVSSEPAT